MSTVRDPSAQRFILHAVSWRMYEPGCRTRSDAAGNGGAADPWKRIGGSRVLTP